MACAPPSHFWMARKRLRSPLAVQGAAAPVGGAPARLGGLRARRAGRDGAVLGTRALTGLPPLPSWVLSCQLPP